MALGWEFYQQPETGVACRLYWICGLAGATTPVDLEVFVERRLGNQTYYAVPFDQQRAVTVSKMFISFRRAPANNGRVRVGIYESAVDNNVPKDLVFTSVERAINGLTGVLMWEDLEIRLFANRRYWAVLSTDEAADGTLINGIGSTRCPTFFYGAHTARTFPFVVPVTGLIVFDRPFEPLPDEFPAVVEANFTVQSAPCIGLAFSSVVPLRAVIMALGRIAGFAPPDSFSPAAPMRAMLSSTAEYVGGTLYGATAFQDAITTGNTATISFIYKGSEANGGVAVGVRWDNSAEQGILAYIDSSGPTLKVVEMSTGWVHVQDDDTALSLTSGKKYTLSIASDGTSATATIVDDSGVQTCTLSTTLNASNTEVMFGWIGTSVSYEFDSYILGFDSSQTGTVATPVMTPSAGRYMYEQLVSLRSTPGAAIYYTTNGATPTTSSTRYTEPFMVSSTQTVKAIGVLAGWTDSSVGTAAYEIIEWTMEAGEIDGNPSGTFSLAGETTGVGSSSAVFMTGATPYFAASAFYDMGGTGNSPAVLFVWDSDDASASAGPMVGTRWDDSAQSGWMACISGGSLHLFVMSAGWTYVVGFSTSVALTDGNTYMLSISDNGSQIQATIRDDNGEQTLSMSSSTGSTNTEIVFGWVNPSSASYTYNTPIASVFI